MEQFFGVTLVMGGMLIAGYIVLGIVIMSVGMLVGLFVRPVLRLISKLMSLIGIQWTFKPYRRVLVLDDDGAYESREIWDGMPDDWMDFDDEWLIGTIAVAVAWPYFVFRCISWPIRRLASA